LFSSGREFVFGVFTRFVFAGTSGNPHILIPFPSRHRHFHPPDFRRQPHDQPTQRAQLLRRHIRRHHPVHRLVVRLAQRQALALQRHLRSVEPIVPDHTPDRTAASAGLRRNLRQAPPQQALEPDLPDQALTMGLSGHAGLLR
tara:strand:+ start:110967 stop:111395 length:429 start_codon:yes stop_codon:yes gene_type:complete